MNKILLFLFSIVYASIGAQSLTQSFNEPAIGEVDKNYSLDTSAYTSGLPTAVTGSNVTWDFSKLEGKFPVIFDSIVAPSAAPGASNHPSASYAQKRGNIISFFKSSSSPQQTEFLGAYSPALTITFTNSAIVATYPVNYGYSSSDVVSGSFKWNSYSGGCNGNITVTADGIGTLIFPNGATFQNVLRLRSVEQVTMNTGIPVGNINQSIYSYYVPGKKYPILTIQYQRYEAIVGTPTITALAYGNFDYFTVAGVHEESGLGTIKVFPNPFTDYLTIEMTEFSGVEYIFYNPLGALVFTGSRTDNLPVAQLPVGVYLLEIRTKSGSAYRRVVRQ